MLIFLRKRGFTDNPRGLIYSRVVQEGVYNKLGLGKMI
jgi:hypothetical protein